MKNLITCVLSLSLVLPLWGQVDSIAVKLTDAQRDSVITHIQRATSIIANNYTIGGVGRYKIYPTTNTYNSLKLDTVTGKVTALQINIGDAIRMEYNITDAVDALGTVIGRYELYPTKNNFNFILLDTINGLAYQVQWSTEKEKCGKWLIW